METPIDADSRSPHHQRTMFRNATPADIAAIREICLLPGYDDYIGCWTVAMHEASLADPDDRTIVATDSGGAVAGFAILRSLHDRNRSIELMRIAVKAPGEGLGRRIFAHCLQLCFEEYNAHRVWLDVMAENRRAQHVYRSFGFQWEGTLRDARLHNGVFQSKMLMSLLEDEYRASMQGKSHKGPAPVTSEAGEP